MLAAMIDRAAPRDTSAPVDLRSNGMPADNMPVDSRIPSLLQPHDGNCAQRLFTPLNIAAYVTWLAVSLGVVDVAKLGAGLPREWIGVAALLAFLALFIACAARSISARMDRVPWLVAVEGVLVLLAEWLLRGGQTAVLLIIVAGQMVLLLPMRAFVVYMLALNAALGAMWFERAGSLSSVLLSLLPMLGFQAFASLTGHYAGSRERAREHLAQVNAELLATRRLLEESARSGERLKLSRELHDVAGHSLTALKLNLARLARDPALAQREEIRVSATLADELLGQIRQVVSTLRAHDGLDLRAALEALAHPVPGTRIEVDVEEGLRVDDVDHAEALLRCAQEAITNALRHGRATRIAVRLRRVDGALELAVENDGAAPAKIEAGNGLTGMRERCDALGGTLALLPTPPRGLRVLARLPERSA
jgi:signal transduction histidine kinase